MTAYGNRVYEDLVECTEEEMGHMYFKLSTFTTPNRFHAI